MKNPTEYTLLGLTAFLVVATVGETVLTMLGTVTLSTSAGLEALMKIQEYMTTGLIGWAIGAHRPNETPTAPTGQEKQP